MLTKDKYGTFKTKAEDILNYFRTNSKDYDIANGLKIKYNGYSGIDEHEDGSVSQHFSLHTNTGELSFEVHCFSRDLNDINLNDFELKFTKTLYKLLDYVKETTLSIMFDTQWGYIDIDTTIKEKERKEKYVLIWEQMSADEPVWRSRKKELNVSRNELGKEVKDWWNLTHWIPLNAFVRMRRTKLINLTTDSFVDIDKLIDEGIYYEVKTNNE